MADATYPGEPLPETEDQQCDDGYAQAGDDGYAQAAASVYAGYGAADRSEDMRMACIRAALDLHSQRPGTFPGISEIIADATSLHAFIVGESK